MVCHDRKCMFIHITRTGGTSVESSFGNPPTDKLRHLVLPANYREYWPDYFMFTTVRNPWDRAVSLYFIGLKMFKEWFTDAMMCNPPGKFTDDFSGFVMGSLAKLVNDRSMFGVNTIFTPQSFWLDGDYDKILRFETLDKDWSELPDSVRPVDVLPRLNESVHKPFAEYYSKETSDIVGELYRKDVEALGYTAPV